MLFLSVLICVSSFLEGSLATKPKPVQLKYSCVRVISPEHQEQKPDDVPIILLHGVGGNKEIWHGDFELFALKTKKRVCAVDLRNHGESPWDSDEYNTEVMAEDIKQLIDELEAPKAVVVGHSLGGKTAVHLALNYPERVERIIVEDMRPNGVTPEGLKGTKIYCQVLKEMQKDIPQGVTEVGAKKAFLKLFNQRLLDLDPSFKLYDDLGYLPIKCLDGKCQLSVNPVLLDVILRDINELLPESSGRFDGPALFIYGGKSPFKVREDESNIKMLFPNAKLVEVEGAEHTVHRFQKFSTEVIKFINDE